MPRASVTKAIVIWRQIEVRAMSSVLGRPFKGVMAARIGRTLVTPLLSCFLSPSRCSILKPLARRRTAPERRGQSSSALLMFKRWEATVIVGMYRRLVGVFESHSNLCCALGAGMKLVPVQSLSRGAALSGEGGGVEVEVHIMPCALLSK